jgi:MFS family permease
MRETAWQELSRRWPVLLGAFLGLAGGVSSIAYYSQGLFVGPLTQTFGWSREQMSLVTLAGGMLLAILSPFVGTLVDRFGVVRPLLVSFCAMIVGYLVLSRIGGSFALFLLVQLLLIGVGSATGPVSFTRIVSENFVAARGFALGATLAGGGVMAIIAPPIIASLIAQNSWREGYLAVAGLVLVCATLSLALLVPRLRSTASSLTVTKEEVSTDAHYRTPDLSSPFIWRLAFTFLLVALGVGGFTFHMVPMLTDAGMDLSSAARIQSLIGVALLVGRLGAGALMDRIFAPYIAASAVLLAALGLAIIAMFGVAAAAPGALLIGLALGAEGDVIGYLTARYFGLAVYGRIYGILYGIFAFGLGLSPLVISRIQAMANSYDPALWFSCAILVVAAVSLLTLPSFQEKAK